MKRLCCLILIGILLSNSISVYSELPKFPLKVSQSGRFLEDSNGKPFFYQAETPWLIFTKLKPEEYSELMDIRIRQGFTVIQVMALPGNGEDGSNLKGDKPFTNNDFSLPNPPYFEYLKQGIKKAQEKGLLVAMAIAWKGCCGGAWNDVILKNGPAKCREYGRFLGKFFKDCPNILWVMGGDNDPGCHTDHYREMALGIKEAIPDALQTYHASSGHSSSDVMNYLDHSWLNFSWTYTYFHQKHNVWIYLCGWGELPEVYQVNHIEYRKFPVKPFILGESQYEGEDSASYKPLSGAAVARRQAWWSLLSGGCGHAYGSWNWSIQTNWRMVANDSGANQMKFVKTFTDSIEWQNLVPDIEQSIIKSGGGEYGKTNYITLAKLSGTSTTIAYIPPTGIEKRTLSLRANNTTSILVQWLNTTNGNYLPKTKLFLINGVAEFSTPGNNGSGVNDWLLIVNN